VIIDKRAPSRFSKCSDDCSNKYGGTFRQQSQGRFRRHMQTVFGGAVQSEDMAASRGATGCSPYGSIRLAASDHH
jgi:hypothetical protein